MSKKTVLQLLLLIPLLSVGQTLYIPQVLYDASGGLYEPTILRELHVDFHDPNYHNVLADFFTQTLPIEYLLQSL